jgi:tRNA(Ile)-lysidine synthetase-like protein
VNSLNCSHDFLVSELKVWYPPYSSLLLAVSGGLDSMFMWHITTSLKEELNLEINVVHVNHNLRSESNDDADFVCSQAIKLGTSVYVATLNPPKPFTENMESWARRERYNILEKYRVQLKANYIMTAHQSNDVIETFLMRIFANKTPRGINRRDEKRKLIRPMLSISRSVIENYAKDNYLEFCIDKSNYDIKKSRNLIRHQIIPDLKKNLGISIESILFDQANKITASYESLDLLIKDKYYFISSSFCFGSKLWHCELCLLLNSLTVDLRNRTVEVIVKDIIGFYVGQLHAIRIVDFFLNYRKEVELPGRVKLVRLNKWVMFSII